MVPDPVWGSGSGDQVEGARGRNARGHKLRGRVGREFEVAICDFKLRGHGDLGGDNEAEAEAEVKGMLGMHDPRTFIR